MKQGEKGVSLQEQRASIENYARRQQIEIAEWYEERLTAAKKGRPLFAKMLKKLRNGEANGVVIHKIDRGARNLRDWAELGELIDVGVAVHFANESLDLLSRGGRLSADIQAVVAADYIRNLREETLKGIRGRLKQGLYPFYAPLGYLDAGGGRLKTVDDSRAPLVREAFALYATGRYSLDSLRRTLHDRGLRNRRGNSLSRNSLSLLLNNPFYAGLIRIRRNGETYAGAHEPLISMDLFKQVQDRLSGKARSTAWLHDFTLRGLFRCSLCDTLLIGERQKGHVYYRCHTKSCPTKAFREERLEVEIFKRWPDIAVTDAEKNRLSQVLKQIEAADLQDQGTKTAALRTRLADIKARIARLIDAYIDQGISREDFESRKAALLEEQKLIEGVLARPAPTPATATAMALDALELASSAQQSYRLADPSAKRELAIRLCSNLTVARKKVYVKPYYPLHVIGNRLKVLQSDPKQDEVRTSAYPRAATEHICGKPRGPRNLSELAWKLWNWGRKVAKQGCLRVLLRGG